MKEAQRQAEAIEADKREEETIKNLKAAAENKVKAAKAMGTAKKAAKDGIELILSNTPREHQAKAINAKRNAFKLLAKLKEDGDVNSIVSDLKKLIP
jgi:uncharacterized protein YegP (UPF0339 family)